MFWKIIPLLVPYFTVGTGLYVFHSVWLAIISYHMGMLCVILLSEKKPPVKQLFKSNNYKAPVIMAVIGAWGGVLLFVLAPFLAIPSNFASYTYSIGLTERTWLPFITYYVFATPLIEEFYWRGLLHGHTSKRIIPSDLLFAGYHLLVLAGKIGMVWLPMVFLLMSLVAWLWRHVNKMSGGLLPSVLSHFTADISVILAIYWIAVYR